MLVCVWTLAKRAFRMHKIRRVRNWCVGIGLVLAAPGWWGCGFERIQPALPNAFPDFDFEDLRAIQRDERLTLDERREAVRTAIGAPMTPEGDRLVNYLLSFTIP